MRRISAVRGMTFGLKYESRQVFVKQVLLKPVFQENIARDNGEAVIGTQLRLARRDCQPRWPAESEER
jgi:hypothetical protein